MNTFHVRRSLALIVLLAVFFIAGTCLAEKPPWAGGGKNKSGDATYESKGGPPDQGNPADDHPGKGKGKDKHKDKGKSKDKDAEHHEYFTDDKRTGVQVLLHHLRQQNKKAPGLPNFCLSDFVAPKETGVPDYVGAFAVTAGIGIEEHVKKFEAAHDDYHAILLKALADRLAEALAERMHERVRKEFWGYAQTETLQNDQLIAEAYRGIRPAPGYPACPEHTEKRTLWKLLQPENLGITLTESCAMYPAAAVSGWYFSHPESRYFGLGQIGKDQVENYARRKGMSIAEAERWLAPVLNYDV